MGFHLLNVRLKNSVFKAPFVGAHRKYAQILLGIVLKECQLSMYTLIFQLDTRDVF